MKENKSVKIADYKDLFRIQIPSHPKYISSVRSLAFNLARENGFTLDGSADLKLIVGESVLNVIKHSYEGKNDLPVFIEFKFYPDKVEIRIRDFGIKIDPMKYRSSDLEDYREDGLGIYLMRKLTDHFYLDQSPPVGNKLILMKLK